MVKTHNVRMIVENNSGFTMIFKNQWYDSGRPADTYIWPKSVENSGKIDMLSYEKDWSLAGCSGTVDYEINDTLVTFAFSNPSVVTNKLGVGTTGILVWDEMDNHNYQPFVVNIVVSDVTLKCDCQCTGDTTNLATVNISRV